MTDSNSKLRRDLCCGGTGASFSILLSSRQLIPTPPPPPSPKLPRLQTPSPRSEHGERHSGSGCISDAHPVESSEPVVETEKKKKAACSLLERREAVLRGYHTQTFTAGERERELKSWKPKQTPAGVPRVYNPLA